jgi:hypothetical protein
MLETRRLGGMLLFNRIENIDNLLALMKIQNSYIHELNKLIFVAAGDVALANNHEFAKFVTRFFEFTYYHYNSEGYSQAAQLVQNYHYILLERLLDNQMLAAAEQMELAIGHLEMAGRDIPARYHPQIILLNQGILQIEETQLKIIENLEALFESYHFAPKLQN